MGDFRECDFCGGVYPTLLYLPLKTKSAITGLLFLPKSETKKVICLSCIEIQANIKQKV